MLILLAALVLRVWRLGEPGFWIDEDLTWLTVQGVHDTGLPWHPSGLLYWRAPLYTYLVSLFAAVGGSSELVLRLPGALLGVALVALVYRFGRDLGGPWVATLAALLLTFSPWNVHASRMARMYPLFFLLFTLAVYLLYKGVGEGGSRRARAWALVCAPMVVLSHQIGALLGLVFLATLVLPRRDRPPVAWAAGGAALSIVPFLLLRRLGKIVNGGESGLSSVREDPSTVALPLVGRLELNHARLFLLEQLRESPLVGLGVALLLIALTAWFLLRLRRSGEGVPALLAALGFVAALAANELTLALVAGFLLLKLRERGGAASARLALMMAGVAATVLFLVVTGSLLALGWEEVASRPFLRAFVAFPKPWWSLVLRHFPLTTLVAGAGTLAIFFASLKRKAPQGPFLVATACFLPLLLIGIIAAPFFLVRYTVYVQPLLALLFALTVVRVSWALVGMVLAGRREGSGDAAGSLTGSLPVLSPAGRLVLGGLCLVGFLVSDIADPLQARNVTRRSYGSNRELIRDPGLRSHYYFDHKTPALFLASRRAEGDLVIARDPLNHTPYMSPPHYMLRGSRYASAARPGGGKLVEKSLGVPILYERKALEDLLRANGHRRIWILYSDGGEKGPILNLPPDLLELLRSLEGHRVYTGEDGITFVLELPRTRSAADFR